MKPQPLIIEGRIDTDTGAMESWVVPVDELVAALMALVAAIDEWSGWPTGMPEIMDAPYLGAIQVLARLDAASGEGL